MSAKECAVCAWRAKCNLKFNYQASDNHCKEYTRDVTMPASENETEDDKEKDQV
ncbi:hypothetical protein MNBD_NITROSPINAE02-625 [hydrothermal vent metagenome]|uniref:Uncharacterized protein n=1 Tax=hydrothermal vent metagenome TaxID=652676 RepID=A0A3B1C1P6_9ZZZZ